MKPEDERRYGKLSPFELKNKLVALAKERSERTWLNAGRGNPNWLALAPRAAFFRLGLFALEEASRASWGRDLGRVPEREGIANRLQAFVSKQAANPGVRLLGDGVELAAGLGLARDEFVGELVDGVLGDHYPLPGRMLPCAERIVHALLEREVLGGSAAGRFDLFAVEGATAGIAYVFDTLFSSGLLRKGDKIALGAPIFSPYIEVPRLDDFGLVEIELMQDEKRTWQYPDSELEKLRDPDIRALLVVNPSNPTAVSMGAAALEKIGEIVATARADLIIVTDDVYATFANGFRSIAAVAPRNTILVYSWSKYWGATGWRLGVLGVHEDSALDQMLQALPAPEQERARRRYGAIALEPARMKLIDRLMADSRAVALNHTAGLSTPQQVQMTLFALHALLDRQGDYRAQAQAVVRRRFAALYAGIGIAAPADPHFTHYYATIDIPVLARERYGKAFAAWLTARHEPIDFVVRLAEEKSVVLMDGGGFDAPRMSVRVSLANLPDDAYHRIGEAISALLADYHRQWRETG
jgi:aspartate 4-decarboxylase